MLQGPVRELPHHLSNNMGTVDHLVIELDGRFVVKSYRTRPSKTLYSFLGIAQVTGSGPIAIFGIWYEDGVDDTLMEGQVRKHMPLSKTP